MSGPDPAELERLRSLLEQTRRAGRVLTYLEVADALALPPPHRIHRTTGLIESLLEQDVRAGRTPLAALVVGKSRGGRPAPGFFDCARKLGIHDGSDPAGFHEQLLSELFGPVANKP